MILPIFLAINEVLIWQYLLQFTLLLQSTILLLEFQFFILFSRDYEIFVDSPAAQVFQNLFYLQTLIFGHQLHSFFFINHRVFEYPDNIVLPYFLLSNYQLKQKNHLEFHHIDTNYLQDQHNSSLKKQVVICKLELDILSSSKGLYFWQEYQFMNFHSSFVTIFSDIQDVNFTF